MPDVRVRRADLQLDHGQVGAGYAAMTPAAREAIRLAARTEGIFLDPTYTARALAGLIARVAGGGIKREDAPQRSTPRPVRPVTTPQRSVARCTMSSTSPMPGCSTAATP